SAYKRKQNVVFYYWYPTPLVGALDLVKLELPPYDAEKHKCLTAPKCANPQPSAYPENPVFTAVNTEFSQKAPKLTEFLSKVSIPLPEVDQTLAHMEESGDDSAAVAQWFLKNKSDVWTKWVPAESRRASRPRCNPALASRRPARCGAALPGPVPARGRRAAPGTRAEGHAAGRSRPAASPCGTPVWSCLCFLKSSRRAPCAAPSTLSSITWSRAMPTRSRQCRGPSWTCWSGSSTCCAARPGGWWCWPPSPSPGA